MSTFDQLFSDARAVMPGGVNSPVRAFKRVGGAPVFFSEAHGARLTDVDGKDYIDYIGSWGPAIVGHAHPDVVAAVQAAAARGLSFGAPTVMETELAGRILSYLPGMDRIRMVNSGTEATMSAIRVARGFTGRDKIVKFEGCYHGHSDSLLVKAGSGALTLGEPDSAGVPKSFAEHTLTLTFNDAEEVSRVMAEIGEQVAAIIVEPIAGNMGMVPPEPGFLQALRTACDNAGALLIFDEVMTGFRVALHGAQGHYGVQPDMTTLGKVVGGGMPVGAFAGRSDVMAVVAPDGPVYQAGTLSGNPVAMAAGLATLDIITTDGFFSALGERTDALMQGLQSAADEAGVPFSTTSLGGMFGFFFSPGPVTRFSQVMNADTEAFNRFFHAMLAEGINLAPSPFESGFVSAAHTEADIAQTLDAARRAFKQ